MANRVVWYPIVGPEKRVKCWEMCIDCTVKNMGDLRQRVASLESELTPAFVECTVRELLLQREDESRGVGALGLVMYLLGDLAQRGVEITWAYARLKPALLDAVEHVPSLRFLDGG